ncbi:MAG TPA: 23S rRNA (pseudouridine(1915)-N(3))-methyltransferase RlmH [Casimicrobiaceae bacterium]|nr:23S rRNA (pseudouridine(1915)-N(3))-methyltransferase RlmH [Casimicrobiaceae bacterium]
MKLRVIALAHKLPAWVSAACEDYARRLPREFPLEICEIRPAPRNRGKSVEQILVAEGERIVAASQGCLVVALDERGEPWTTARLARALSRWHDDGRSVAFVIGSADGLSPKLKREANAVVALSALTLPHGLARVVLVEQLYRAVSMLRGHPYHRE